MARRGRLEQAETLTEARALRRTELSERQVAKQLGVARSTLQGWKARPGASDCPAAYSAEGCHPFRCESCHLIHAKVATQSRGTLPPVGAKRRGMVHCYSEGVGVVKFA
jgi:hypothetical protein